MWREQLGWTAVRILLPWLAGAALIAALFDRGALCGSTAIGAALVLLGLLAGAGPAADRRVGLAARGGGAPVWAAMGGRRRRPAPGPAGPAAWPGPSRP